MQADTVKKESKFYNRIYNFGLATINKFINTKEKKILDIGCSSGYFLDNLADNILASIFLHNNSKDIKIIATGNIWQDKHFETLIKSGLFGFRTFSIHTLENFLRFNLSQQKE